LKSRLNFIVSTPKVARSNARGLHWVGFMVGLLETAFVSLDVAALTLISVPVIIFTKEARHVILFSCV
jgi:hypothetical protein